MSSDLRYLLRELDDTDPSLIYFETSRDRYILFDRDQAKKDRDMNRMLFRHRFTSTDELASKRWKEKLYWHNFQYYRDMEPVRILDCEENTVYEPKPFEPLPGKLISNDAQAWILALPEFENESGGRARRSREEPAEEGEGSEADDLHRLRADYVGLTLEAARLKADSEGLGVVVIVDNGEWKYAHAPENENKTFGVLVNDGIVVAIYHDEFQVVKVWLDENGRTSAF